MKKGPASNKTHDKIRFLKQKLMLSLMTKLPSTQNWFSSETEIGNSLARVAFQREEWFMNCDDFMNVDDDDSKLKLRYR